MSNNSSTPFAKVIWTIEDAACVITETLEQAGIPSLDDDELMTLAERLAFVSTNSIENQSVELGWEILKHYMETDIVLSTYLHTPARKRLNDL